MSLAVRVTLYFIGMCVCAMWVGWELRKWWYDRSLIRDLDHFLAEHEDEVAE